MWDNLHFFRTLSLKSFHEIFVGNHPILKLQISRKISREFKVVVFPMFLYNYVVEYNPTIIMETPIKLPWNPNIINDKPPKISDWVYLSIQN